MNILQFASALFGGALIISACAKLTTRDELVRFLVAVGLSETMSKLALAFGLTAEVLIGLALAGNMAPLVSAGAALVLGALFVTIQMTAHARRVDMSCGCSGFLTIDSPFRQEFLQAIVFGGLALILTACVLASSPTSHAVVGSTNILGAFMGGGAILALSNFRYATRALQKTRVLVRTRLP